MEIKVERIHSILHNINCVFVSQIENWSLLSGTWSQIRKLISIPRACECAIRQYHVSDGEHFSQVSVVNLNVNFSPWVCARCNNLPHMPCLLLLGTKSGTCLDMTTFLFPLSSWLLFAFSQLSRCKICWKLWHTWILGKVKKSCRDRW